jgi:hypothetical protein
MVMTSTVTPEEQATPRAADGFRLPTHLDLPPSQRSPDAPPLFWPDHTMLPDKDGSFVKNAQEPPQSSLLTESLRPVLRQLHPDGQFFIGMDLGIYWTLPEPPEPPQRGAVAPDWFYVPHVSPLRRGQVRRSYLLWDEAALPLLVLEYVSGDGSEERDRTPRVGKFWFYESHLRVPFYGIFEPKRSTLEVHHLVDAQLQPMAANAHGRFPIAPLGVELGIWQGVYQDLELPWLRWWDAQGNLLPTPEEEAERQRQRAEEEHQRAERLAARLRALGVDPDQL